MEEMNQSHQALSMEVTQLKATIDEIQQKLHERAQEMNNRLGNLETLTTSFEPRISSIETKTQSITVEEPSRALVITGVNLHIRNECHLPMTTLCDPLLSSSLSLIALIVVCIDCW